MGPRYRPRIIRSSGYVRALSQNITQSNQSNSQIWLMSVVVPVIMVSGFLPMVIWILLHVEVHIKLSNSMQWSQWVLEKPVFNILCDVPHLSSWIQPSVAFTMGECGSVCLKWQSASRSLRRKSLRVCSLDLPIKWLEGPHPGETGGIVSYAHRPFASRGAPVTSQMRLNKPGHIYGHVWRLYSILGYP